MNLPPMFIRAFPDGHFVTDEGTDRERVSPDLEDLHAWIDCCFEVWIGPSHPDHPDFGKVKGV